MNKYILTLSRLQYQTDELKMSEMILNDTKGGNYRLVVPLATMEDAASICAMLAEMEA